MLQLLFTQLYHHCKYCVQNLYALDRFVPLYFQSWLEFSRKITDKSMKSLESSVHPCIVLNLDF